MADAVEDGHNEVHHRESTGIEGRVVVGTDVVVHGGNVGGLHEVASSGEGLAEPDGGVPEPVNANGSTRSGEACGLAVDRKENVGVGKDTAVSLFQPRAVVGNDLAADVERCSCDGVRCDAVNDQEGERSHRDAGQVRTRREQIG